MKKAITILFLTTAVLLNIQTINAQSGTAEIDAKESSIHWLGKKVTGEHTGTISLASGSLVLKEGQLAGGFFEVDMSSITCTDLEGTYKGKLEKHLKSEDFFGVEEHPKAKLVFAKIRSKGEAGAYEVIGNLTIKGITNPVNFDIKLVDNTATAKVVVDRSKFDVRYGSNSFFDNLGDKTIYDDFELEVTLKL